jgi:hypothetical protein
MNTNKVGSAQIVRTPPPPPHTQTPKNQQPPPVPPAAEKRLAMEVQKQADAKQNPPSPKAAGEINVTA